MSDIHAKASVAMWVTLAIAVVVLGVDLFFWRPL